MKIYFTLLLIILTLSLVSAARLEFIEKIPETLGTMGIAIIILVVVLLIIFFILYRYYKNKKIDQTLKPGLPEQTKPELDVNKPFTEFQETSEKEISGRLLKLKQKLQNLQSKRSVGISLSAQ
jgi:hypothetical protein